MASLCGACIQSDSLTKSRVMPSALQTGDTDRMPSRCRVAVGDREHEFPGCQAMVQGMSLLYRRSILVPEAFAGCGWL